MDELSVSVSAGGAVVAVDELAAGVVPLAPAAVVLAAGLLDPEFARSLTWFGAGSGAADDASPVAGKSLFISVPAVSPAGAAAAGAAPCVVAASAPGAFPGVE